MKKWLWFALLFTACREKFMTSPSGDVMHRTDLQAQHVPSCTDNSKCGRDEPPAGGPHCPTPLSCRIWTDAQPRCQYIHNLEHGHMVLAYNCSDGCPDIVKQLTDFYNSLPIPRRALLTPDPNLKTKVAAMVWGYTWSGDRVDTVKLQEILNFQDDEAPEAWLGCNP